MQPSAFSSDSTTECGLSSPAETSFSTLSLLSSASLAECTRPRKVAIRSIIRRRQRVGRFDPPDLAHDRKRQPDTCILLHLRSTRTSARTQRLLQKSPRRYLITFRRGRASVMQQASRVKLASPRTVGGASPCRLASAADLGAPTDGRLQLRRSCEMCMRACMHQQSATTPGAEGRQKKALSSCGFGGRLASLL